MKFAYLLTVLLVCVTGSVRSEGCVYSEYRLPHHIRPEHYDLFISADTDAYTYKGDVKISLEVDPLPNKVPANIIVLHASRHLEIYDIKFNDLTTTTTTKKPSRLNRLLHRKKQDKPISVKSFCRDQHNELFVITLTDKLVAGTKAELFIKFESSIHGEQDSLRGFYQNKYGRNKAMVSTQFEATSARDAFPCFDEPTFKATFDVSIEHDPKLVALSNAPVESESRSQSSEHKVTKFKRTPRMSTYLLAWAIGPLSFSEQVVADGRITIRAYALPGLLNQTKFALDTAVRSITMMEEFFDVPFAMEKIDMVGLPTFAMGATENWGLIFYLDMMFLYDEANPGATMKGWVATTVVHELAHQWFGNLVTMAWWNDLWLNEGLATWMQDYFTEQLYPEFEWRYEYLIQTHIKGLDADISPHTHSIRVEKVGRNIDDLFDDIVYKKASAVLRHIHDDYLGPERFREGIRKYIKKHLYRNTEASDLWGAFAEASGLPVDKLMESWITQPGHPEVKVELSAGEESLLLRQSRHYQFDPDEDEKRPEQTWMIPLSLIVADDKGNMDTIKLMMENKEMEVKLPGWFDASNQGHWVKLNAGFRGFYRVNYSHDLIMRLEKPCRGKSLETVDRMNVIYDVFTDPITKSLSKDEMLDVFSWFKDDHEGAILVMRHQAYINLRDIDARERAAAGANMLEQSEFRNKLDESLLATYKQIHAEQGFRIESSEPSVTDANGVARAFMSLVEENHQPLIQDALEEFDRSGNRANVNLREAMYKAVGKFGSPEQIERLKQLDKIASDKYEKSRTQDALLSVRD